MTEHYINQMLAAWPGSEKGKERFAATAMALALRDPVLRDCSPASKLIALNECAKLGLIPDRHLGHIWLVPFRNKGVQEVQCIPGYKGYIELARRSGLITTVETGLVYENDHLDFVKGSSPHLIHKPWWDNGASSAGQIKCVYCIAHVRNATVPQIEVMHITEVMAIKKRSRAGNNGPWVTDFEMMARKTPIRRAAKLWSLSPELAALLMLDDAVELGEPQFATTVRNPSLPEMELTDGNSGQQPEVEPSEGGEEAD